MDKQTVIRAGRESVLAFRLQQHHLNHRLPSGALLEGAKLCGIRNSPPGSAELSFAVRLTSFFQQPTQKCAGYQNFDRKLGYACLALFLPGQRGIYFYSGTFTF